jgi:nitroreductase
VSDVLEAARKRRSIRKYEGRMIEPELVAALQEAVLRAPSSRGLRPWRFAFVAGREKLEELSRCKPRYASFLADSALGVVVAADDSVSDAWVEDCSIAAAILQLTATSLGLGSCWIQIRNRPHDDATSAEEYVQRALGWPKELRVECIIALSYPAEDKQPLPDERLKHDAIVEL